MSRNSSNVSAADALGVIDQQRLLLKRLVGVARIIQRLQEGLRAVLILGESADKLPPEVQWFISSIGEQIKSQSDDKIRDYIGRLEELIRQGLDQVMRFAAYDLDRVQGIALSEHSMQLLKEFRRRAQTTVSLRLLMQQRGVPVPGPAISLPVAKIRQRLEDLDVKERLHREKVVLQISEMREDLCRMMLQPEYPDEMKGIFQSVIDGLDRDIQAIASGVKLGQLELSFEAVLGRPASVDNTVIAPPEAQSEASAERPEKESAEQVISHKSPGFFRRMITWLNTPWSVTWREIRQGGGKKRS